jgi:hypothetical protein
MITPFRRIGFFSTALVAMALLAQAQLTFENTTLTVPAQWSDTEIKAGFKFKNTGNQAIKINEIATSCGCTVATLEKRVYAPGESGEVNVVMTITGAEGPMRKEVTLSTNSTAQPAIGLNLQTTVPVVMQVDPKVVYWSKKDSLAPKVIAIGILPGITFEKFEAVTSDPKNFIVEVKETVKGRHFDVTVTPVKANTGDEAIRDTLTLTLRLADGKAISRTAYELLL